MIWIHYDESPGAELLMETEPLSTSAAHEDGKDIDQWYRWSTFFGYLTLAVALVVFWWYAIHAAPGFWDGFWKGLLGI